MSAAHAGRCSTSLHFISFVYAEGSPFFVSRLMRLLYPSGSCLAFSFTGSTHRVLGWFVDNWFVRLDLDLGFQAVQGDVSSMDRAISCLAL